MDLQCLCGHFEWCEACSPSHPTVLAAKELAECKAKLARVEAELDAARAEGAEKRADDYGGLYECLRAALEGP